MIGIIDYGMGNILSVSKAFEMIGAEVTICNGPEDLAAVERIVLPGVGAFQGCMDNLRRAGFVEALEEMVLAGGKPILGICLGMQAMARRSFEHGEFPGLGWFDADVVRLDPADTALRVPQVGWNDIDFSPGIPLFAGLRPGSDFYFVHSYYMKCRDQANVAATCDYGGEVTAAVIKNNIFATQFHPEKSQDYGLRLLRNFVAWKP
ncbi:MAG: imidazole glycerol phosphate synthase subunit HisH [Deltaproteobacteria bacterium]|nr:imidazole glycerol phosphate synthase subunit HisH [Deltaproteobacteria bacterium]